MNLPLKTIITALGLAFAAPMAQAGCMGQNLFEALPEARKIELQTRAEAAPFAEGNLWQATKGEDRLTIVGTYHLEDDRHYDTLAELDPYWDEALGLLVEATKEEERALQRAIVAKPELVFITKGPTLLQLLPADLWAELSAALSARGVPSIMAAKYQPWFAALALGFAPCDAAAAKAGGLDALLLLEAEIRDLPAQALEPYDTLFTLFEDLSDEEEIKMLKSTLALEEQIEDVATTMAELYFSGRARLLWEMTRELSYEFADMSREEVDAEMARIEELTMSKRNRAWIAKLEAAAAEGPHIAAFGALHLSGEEGVLNLLAKRGWALEQLF